MNMRSISIGGTMIGAGYPAYIIAEIGSNHGGRLERAKRLISACAKAGANAVKFQSWTAERLHNVKDVAPDGSLSDAKAIPILRKLEVPDDWHSELVDYCRPLGVHFLSTPFDVDRARLLKRVGCPAIKISSSDVVYDQLLEEVASYDLPILMSVGMADLGEIEHALDCLGTARLRTVLLHCVAAYPPVYEDVNLHVLRPLKTAFGLPVGFSDHLPGHDLVLAAVALGATVIEKHVTFSRQDETPDSFYALTIEELVELVQAVRRLESAMGDGRKRCMPSEQGGLTGGRRCVFAARDLKVGSKITQEDLAVVRPNIGEIKPWHVNALIGRTLRRDVARGVPLSWRQFES